MNETSVPPRELLQVQGLTLRFPKVYGDVEVVQDVSFTVRPGEAVGLVGESGCGKSLSCYAIAQLLPQGCVASGRILFEGQDLLRMTSGQMRRVQGREITMIYQDPMTSLNPVMKVGRQVAEAVNRSVEADVTSPDEAERASSARRHSGVLDQVLRLLHLMGLPSPPEAARRYPFELSGGMRQRILMAMGIAPAPKLIMADEPTTALDVTIQAQILDLLKRMQRERNFAVLYVTHDLGIVREFCQRVVVMYAGQMIEVGPTEAIFTRPRQPYTIGLLQSAYSRETSGGRLQTIPGMVASPRDFPPGCRFQERCLRAAEVCRQPLPTVDVGPEHIARCHRIDPDEKGLL